jgi:hypothetical protein
MTSVGQLANMNTFERRLALKPHSAESKRALAYLASLGMKQALEKAATCRDIIELLTEDDQT